MQWSRISMRQYHLELRTKPGLQGYLNCHHVIQVSLSATSTQNDWAATLEPQGDLKPRTRYFRQVRIGQDTSELVLSSHLVKINSFPINHSFFVSCHLHIPTCHSGVCVAMWSEKEVWVEGSSGEFLISQSRKKYFLSTQVFRAVQGLVKEGNGDL